MEKTEIFEKTANMFNVSQKKEGEWVERKIKHGEPQVYHRDLVTTSQVIQSLLFMGLGSSTEAISKGIIFCKLSDIEEHDEIDLWAAKLSGLSISNLYEKEKKGIIDFIVKKQVDGTWPKYQISHTLSNYKILTALAPYSLPGVFEKAIIWFKNNMSKDKNGWGYIGKSDISYPTFTSNAVISLIICGENPDNAYLQKVKKFIEQCQNKDGSWSSSALSVQKPTIYATAVCTLALMLLSKNPFNKNVDTGIQYLLKNADKKGGWPLIKNDASEVYTTYYALQTIGFYDYFKEKIESSRLNSLKNSMPLNALAGFMFREFLGTHIKNKLLGILLKQILNSKSLAATSTAIKRRKDILEILKDGPKDVAGIIDQLNKRGYDLNKKYHMTQIKFDVEHLRAMKIINKIRNEYFAFFDIEQFSV